VWLGRGYDLDDTEECYTEFTHRDRIRIQI
jgi:hypothetical protein